MNLELNKINNRRRGKTLRFFHPHLDTVKIGGIIIFTMSRLEIIMKKVIIRMVMAFGFILAFLLILFLIWVIMSPGKIREYEGEKSLSEKFVMDINDAPNGFFINSKNTDNPVLLFVSSGPGTDDYFFTDKYKDMNLEDYFTVVYWDYRDMGIAYDPDFDLNEVTLENILKDTKSVTDYLKSRFGKSKIYIMGFSGGTHIALRAAREHPEDYYALINMAQCITDSYDNDSKMYEFMKDVFTKRGDSKSLKRLENAVEKLDDGKVKCKNWYDFVYLVHEAGGGTVLNKSETTGIAIPVILSRCYTIKEKINYIPAMKKYRTTPLYSDLSDFDYRKEVTKLEIPAFFISGEYDYNCPWELVEDYCKLLDAPDKEFYKIPNAAHSPLWENAEATCDIMRQIKERTLNE